MKQKYRHIVISKMVLFLLIIFPVLAFAQDFSEKGYLGSGVAKITNGNVSAARKKAFIDAQEKVIISAVSSQLSLGDMSKYFLYFPCIF